MTKKTCEFVEASELFVNHEEAWELFMNSDPDCSWGDNNRTLVTANFIADHLENVDDDNECELFIAELRKLGQTYVDLEN